MLMYGVYVRESVQCQSISLSENNNNNNNHSWYLLNTYVPFF